MTRTRGAVVGVVAEEAEVVMAVVEEGEGVGPVAIGR